jgi:hypothetical protein
MIDPPGADTVLSGLEDELVKIIDDDDVVVEGDDETENETEDSTEGTSRKNAFNRLTERIRNAVTSRKSIKH